MCLSCPSSPERSRGAAPAATGRSETASCCRHWTDTGTRTVWSVPAATATWAGWAPPSTPGPTSSSAAGTTWGNLNASVGVSRGYGKWLGATCSFKNKSPRRSSAEFAVYKQWRGRYCKRWKVLAEADCCGYRSTQDPSKREESDNVGFQKKLLKINVIFNLHESLALTARGKLIEQCTYSTKQ